MLHPATELRFVDPIVGNGIFTATFIPKGSIVWVKDALDREFLPADFYAHPPILLEKLLTYSYRNRKGNYIFCWDNAKYINHSFFPNCMTTPYGFEIAIRDIPKGGELTNDYGTLNIIEPFTPLDEGHARKTVFPDDLKTFSPLWDEMISLAILQIDKVPQPLWELLSADTKQIIEDLTNKITPFVSVMECLYDEGREE
ncbi:MAG: SET domain-containing protein [Breznakibacter sp.]